MEDNKLVMLHQKSRDNSKKHSLANNQAKNPLDSQQLSPLRRLDKRNFDIKAPYPFVNFDDQNFDEAVNLLTYGLEVEVIYQKQRKRKGQNTSMESGYLMISEEYVEELVFYNRNLMDQVQLDVMKVRDLKEGKPKWKLPRIKNYQIPTESELYLTFYSSDLKMGVTMIFRSGKQRRLAHQAFQYQVEQALAKLSKKKRLARIEELLSEISNDFSANYSFNWRELESFINRLRVQLSNHQMLKLMERFFPVETQKIYRASQTQQKTKQQLKQLQEYRKQEEELGGLQNVNNFGGSQKIKLQQPLNPPRHSSTEFDRYNTAYLQKLQQMKLQIHKDKMSEILLSIVTKEEIIPIYMKYSQADYQTPLAAQMSFEQFYQFVKDQNLLMSQKSEYITEFQSREIFQHLISDRPGVTHINLIEFTRYVYSNHNSIFSPKKQLVYQDMNQPLSYYYINSAKAVYSNQFAQQKYFAYTNPSLEDLQDEESKYFPITYALSRGVRYLEIDVWEGEFEEFLEDGGSKSEILPCIQFGLTLTSKIKLEDFLEYLSDNAFRTNQFPFFLDICSHCSPEFNQQIRDSLVKILDDKLYLLEQENYRNFEKYKSPNELKNRIIVVSKVPGYLLKESEDWKNKKKQIDLSIDSIDRELQEVFQTDDRLERQKLSNIKIYMDQKSKFKKPKLKNYLEEKFFDQEQKNHQAILSTQNNQELEVVHTLHEEDPENQNPPQLTSNLSHGKGKGILYNNAYPQKPDLSKYLKSDGIYNVTSFFILGIEQTLHPQLHEIYTINTKQMNLFLTNDSILQYDTTALKDCPDILGFSKDYLLKLTPYGKQIDMKNSDFIKLGFKQGVQIIMNHPHTFDLNALIYYSKFKENGFQDGGYLLKPLEYRVSSQALQRSIRQSFDLQIISAQKIRIPLNSDTSAYVVEVIFSDSEYDENLVHQTEPKRNQNISPIWNQTFNFKSEIPDLSQISFQVLDFPAKKTLLGWNSVPVSLIRPGLRTVPLLDEFFNTIPESYLLVNVTPKPF